MDDFAYFFVPMGYAPWGIGNPAYIAVPVAFIALCVGVYISRRRREPRVLEDVEPGCEPPAADPELIAALANRESYDGHSAEGAARVMMACVTGLVGSGAIRVSRMDNGTAPDVDLLFEVDRSFGLSTFQLEALALLFPEGRDRVTLDEWLRWFHGKGKHYDKGKRLMRASEQALVDAGLATRRTVARVLINGPLFIFSMCWSFLMVPAFAGVAGGVIAILAVVISLGSFGNTKPLFTQAGADALGAARANLAWARGVAREERLPRAMPHGRRLARVLASVMALGGTGQLAAIAELLGRERESCGGACGEPDSVEQQMVLLYSYSQVLQRAGSQAGRLSKFVDPSASPAGRMVTLLEREQRAIEDR